MVWEVTSDEMHVTTCPSPGAPLGQDAVLTLTPPLPSHPPVEEGGGGGPSSLPTRTSGQVWSTDALLLQQDQEEEGWLLWPLLARLLMNAIASFFSPCLFQL